MAVTKRTRKTKGRTKTIFHAEIYVRGVRIADKTFETAASAHTWHDQEKRRWESGQISVGPDAEDMTFRDCLNGYLEEAFTRLKKSSQQSKATRLVSLNESPVMNVRMRDLGPMVIDQWLSWLHRHPTKTNPGRKTFLLELELLTTILTWYRNERDPMFVVPIVKRHRERCHYKQVQARRPDYFIKASDVQRWINWLRRQRRNPVYYRLATFMVLTGARVSEACGLCWDSVELESAMARIVRSVSWDHWTREPTLEFSTKTEESVRIVPLSTDIVDQLALMRQGSAGSGPVFQDRNGELLRYNAIQSAFNAGFKALGLPWRSTHICRHTFGTLALVATRDLGAVQASLGHRSRAMTERYAKTVALLSTDTAEKTAQLIRLSAPDHVQNHVLEVEAESRSRVESRN